MKIEKINDKQIRCTLTRQDLADRNINASELSYGNDKVRELFQDMMQVAEQDFGFEADNIPLVIEAIPISMDMIILIITKVEDPEELDTRFARFSPESDETDNGFSYADLRDQIEGADDILDLIKRLSDARKRLTGEAASTQTQIEAQTEDSDEVSPEELPNLTRAYVFRSLDDAIDAASAVGTLYEGLNTLYKDPDDNAFYFLLKKASNSAEQFNKVCNILSEYANPCKYSVGLEAYFAEHMEVIVPDHALESLRALA